MISQKTELEIELMRKGGRILKKIFRNLKTQIRPGATTAHLEEFARAEIRKNKVESSFLGYRGYPAALCCSVNQEVVHGIPGKKRLKRGDIISLDLGIKYHGFHVDRAETFPVGKIAPVHQKLIKVCQKALIAGIAQAKAGAYIRDISRAIQKEAERAGFSVVRDCTGHGIGREIHEEPNIPNYDTGFSGAKLGPGMTLAIEPMICERSYEVRTAADNWTIFTADFGYAAHCEETIAITESKAEIVTK